MLDYQDFKDAVAELQSFYSGNVLNGGILESAWYETLKHFPLHQLQSAIARCFKKHPRAYNFFPSCDQILEFGQGEYRPPGECVMGDFQKPVLPSVEARLTPEQLAELDKRGLLVARIILNSKGMMSLEKKDELIEQLRTKETHELEAIALTFKESRIYQNLALARFNNIDSTLNHTKLELIAGRGLNPEDTRAIAREWLQESTPKGKSKVESKE